MRAPSEVPLTALERLVLEHGMAFTARHADELDVWERKAKAVVKAMVEVCNRSNGQRFRFLTARLKGNKT